MSLNLGTATAPLGPIAATTATFDLGDNTLAIETGTFTRPVSTGVAVSSSLTSRTIDNPLTTTQSQNVGQHTTGPSSPDEHSSNKAWIAGAVIGPIAFILLLAGAFFLGRRSRRSAKSTTSNDEKGPTEQNPPEQASVPELHEDNILPSQELYGSLPEHPTIAEKPSNEASAQELPASIPQAKINDKGKHNKNYGAVLTPEN
ncbi:unnamed protein product [Clonostachys solani]|uniref:Uncharacterized protein n=1 Tax=Clonostachys solani TaxID=160281 RepID=A0A9N9ZN38_9HYPO|nr:unnamed protein product [Clonostachys solani]